MRAFLLTHSPSMWTWTDIGQYADATRKKQQPVGEWTCASKKVSVGNRVFIMRLGKYGRGIFASGYCIHERKKSPHYDPVLAAQGKTVFKIGIEFDTVLDPDADGYLDISRVREIIGQNWSPRQSGAEIEKGAYEQLESMWKELTENRISAGDTEKNGTVGRFNGYRNRYSLMLIESGNLVFHGAPGTGKSYLAKEIAADIISGGRCDRYEQLSDEQKKQVEFVQFHPSFDYSDFVEGLRPKVNDDGSMGFELQDGIFKRFIAMARKNYEYSLKPMEVIEKELSVQEAISAFFSDFDFGRDTLRTVNGNPFTIMGADDKHINIEIPDNLKSNRLSLRLDEVRRMLESDVRFTRIKDITGFFGKQFATQGYSYDFAIYNAIKDKKISVSNPGANQTELKKYVFIIDEINRGEISKIFGELFFAIDPGYRGRAGEISTQYSNMHSDPDEKFYIPENVYIIGTMNDIDRSVDSFDFAMRRRFRFVELKADDRIEMLDILGDEKKAEAVRRMSSLNREIAAVEDLNENYQIGPAYFLKLKNLDFDRLWTDHLKPLLQDYVRGMYDEAGIMNRFAKAYGYCASAAGGSDEASQN